MKNGFFVDSEREFVITDVKPRRMWNNYLWNEEAVCVCNQFGGGNVWADYEGQRHAIDSGDRNVYIKDKTTGESYSANRNYNDLPFEKHQVHVGLGYHKVVSEYHGIETEFTLLLPTKGTAMLYRVNVKNVSNVTKDLSVYFTICPQVLLTGHTSYGYGLYDEGVKGFIYDHSAFHLKSKYVKVYVGSNVVCDSYDVDEKRFLGEYGGYYKPASLQNDRLCSKGTSFCGEYIAAFQFDLTLNVGEHKTYYFVASAIKEESEIWGIYDRYLSEGVFEEEILKQKEENESYLNVFTVNTPDAYFNSQANIWLKRQLSLGKTWGRVYGKGFRDVMQDITAFVSFDQSLAKKRILTALARQYEDGNPIRMFEPNLRYPYNDGGAWISGTVLSYLNESGDLSILDEKVTYLKGDSYENADYSETIKHEPYVAGERVDSVLDHITAAIDYLLGSRGQHNLILWRGGDWNDSLNNAGTKNIGESVWLSIATVKAINEYKEILKIAGKAQSVIDSYEEKKQELKQAIRAFGMYDGRYIYGINDYGEVVGGQDRMFLNPQTWAVLAEMEDRETLSSVMDKVEENLKCEFGYVQCRPAFESGSDKIGRVSYFRPGLFENGSVYNHGVTFKIVADCLLGRGDSAYQSLKLISCDNPNNEDSGVEPFAVSNMYIGPEDKYNVGYAPVGWLTGTAGWLYRCMSEFIFGIKPCIDGLKIEPCMPKAWHQVVATREFRGEIYNITYQRTGKRELSCDGQAVEKLPLTGKGNVHSVICRF